MSRRNEDYECRHCGYIPTEEEAQGGRCPKCHPITPREAPQPARERPITAGEGKQDS